MQELIAKEIDLHVMADAVKNRDSRYHDSFVFGVSTTGIYCRPTCPSRRPRIEHIRFFSSAMDAKKAGLRPCRRCSPDVPGARAEDLIKDLCRHMDENYGSKLTLAELAKKSGLSQFYLQRRFKKLVGVSPREYAEQARLRNAKLQLRRGLSVRRSSYESGYNTSNFLYSKGKLGMSPSSYKKGGDGMDISYAFANSSLGRLLVAATKYGICYVTIGESDAKLVSKLNSEYPKATITKSNNPKLQNWIRRILGYLDNRETLDYEKLPIDIQVSAFQARVLSAMRKIPPGKTKSYSQLAREVGCPEGARAVGNACASNPVAIVIPCHRVVKNDGSLGGYGLGIDRKKKLLESEGCRHNLNKSGESTI